MKVLYFDCFSGISGDMVIGAFLDLGVEFSYLEQELAKLGVPGFRIEAEKTSRQGIRGTSFSVITEDEGHHGANDSHNDRHQDGHAHRSYRDIKEVIYSSSLDEAVKNTSLAIFERVAGAEAKVHGTVIDDVCFHEVGALDSIVDIVGTAICYHKISPGITLGSAVNVGKGFVNCSHGVLPVPAPATAEIFCGSGFSMYSSGINGESATPTGAAILAGLGTFSSEIPEFAPEKTGYGFGKRDFSTLNALRLFLGERREPDQTVTVLETNMDDMTGEAMGYTMERLFEAGALDVFYTPVFMKKNRPAFKLTVLSDASRVKKLEHCILKETSTIGLRRFPVSRTCMDRRIETRHTEYGDVRVKICRFGEIQKETLEYEDVKLIARKSGLSFDEAMTELQKMI